MRSVRRKDTGPELEVRKALHHAGFRYGLHRKNLPGSPDMVMPKHHVAIFVHGCYWHRHGCRLSTTPKSDRAFWQDKFEKNVVRDRRNVSALGKKGWRVFVIWQCAVHGASKMEAEDLVTAFRTWLESDSLYAELPNDEHVSQRRVANQ